MIIFKLKLLSILIIAFIFWYFGILGHSFYGIPIFIFSLISVNLIYKNKFIDQVRIEYDILKIDNIQINKRFIIYFCIFNGLLWIVIYTLRFYNFSIMTIDTGLYSSVLYNFSKGVLFHSYFNVNPLGDHFVPNIFLLSIFYFFIRHHFGYYMLKQLLTRGLDGKFFV